MFQFEQFPTLQTERLIMRRIVPDDASDIFVIRGNYEVTKYNTGDAYTSITQAQELIQQMQSSYDAQKSIRWGITLNGDDTVIGMVGYNYWDRENNNASIGFDLAQAHWRKGIMREALTAMLDFGFNQMKLHRIAADASLENEASWKLMQSLAFVKEGVLRDEYYEHGTYHELMVLSLLEHEWQPIK